MFAVRLSSETDFSGWKAAARSLRLQAVAPSAVLWRVGEATDLFGGDAPPAASPGAGFTVSRSFLDLAGEVILHSAPERFDLLYRLLWRMRDEPDLLKALTDPEVAQAQRLARQVRDAEHKMHAFLRFRRVDDPDQPNGGPETYAAWFEPAHHIVERGVGFFLERMANLRFSILTPEVCAHWADGALAFSPGMDASQAPTSDALEADWAVYFASVFNPARVNAGLMTRHMPRRYWRNMPEAALIPEMIANAEARAAAMVQSPPAPPSARTRRATPPVKSLGVESSGADLVPDSLAAVSAGLAACRRCALWRDATQAVPGEGPAAAPLMFVGEQPGDLEDLRGRPFVGPAGQLFDRALAQAGVPRDACYVTNAVKHFKHEPRGKRRIHQKPDAGEVKACRWWLQAERDLVRPRVVVALGATAANSVFSRAVSVTRERGPAGDLEGGATGFITVHPSYLLRLPDAAAKAAEFARFVEDLRTAYALI